MTIHQLNASLSQVILQPNYDFFCLCFRLKGSQKYIAKAQLKERIVHQEKTP
jgi:hypothetical protein